MRRVVSVFLFAISVLRAEGIIECFVKEEAVALSQSVYGWCSDEKAAAFAQLVLDIQPDFPYPRALASNLFEMSNNHIYFAIHLPRLTDVHVKDESYDEVEKMLEYFASRMLGIQTPK